VLHYYQPEPSLFSLSSPACNQVLTVKKHSGGDSADGGDPEARCIDAKQDSSTGDALQREYDLIDGLVEFMYDSPPARRQSALFFGILVEEQSLGNAAESSESGSSRSIVR